MNLTKSMRPVASFIFRNQGPKPTRLCLFPGHFDTASTICRLIGASSPYQVTSVLSYADPSPIVAAGYECDQVADDFNITAGLKDSSGTTYSIEVLPKSGKTRYRDFLNFIKVQGLKVTKMRITDLTNSSNPSREIFQQELEISTSSIGSKGGSDFIQLSAHINPAHYLQNFIEIDLESRNLLLDETTLAFLDIPAEANFQIDFTLAE